MEIIAMNNIIKGIILIGILSIIFGIVVPGLLLYGNHIFFEADVLSNMDSSARRKYDNNQREQLSFERRKQQLLGRIQDTAAYMAPEQINQISTAIENIDNLKKKSNKVVVNAFYPKNPTILLWPLIYFGFGCIIFIIGRHLPGKFSKRDYFIFLFLIILFWRWTTWFRNSPLGNINRIVFTLNNIDISPFGFFLQETLSIISLAMLAYIFCKWLAYAEFIRAKLDKNDQSIGHYLSVSENVKAAYKQWQIASLFLAIGFGYYTYYFWSVISDTHDLRYLPQAIIIHFIWGLSWFVISWPLIVSAEIQARFKENLIKYAADHQSSSPIQEEIVNYVVKNDPISTQNQVISTLISGIAFIFPILKNFL